MWGTGVTNQWTEFVSLGSSQLPSSWEDLAAALVFSWCLHNHQPPPPPPTPVTEVRWGHLLILLKLNIESKAKVHMGLISNDDLYPRSQSVLSLSETPWIVPSLKPDCERGVYWVTAGRIFSCDLSWGLSLSPQPTRTSNKKKNVQPVQEVATSIKAEICLV